MNYDPTMKTPHIVGSALLNVDPNRDLDEEPIEGLAVTQDALILHDHNCCLAYPTEWFVILSEGREIPAEAAEALSATQACTVMNACKIVDRYVVMTLAIPSDFLRIAQAFGSNAEEIKLNPYVVLAYIRDNASDEDLKDVFDLIWVINEGLKFFPIVGLKP